MSRELYVLENGLQVAFAPLRDRTQVCIHIAVRSGVFYENAKDNGVSHLLEHLHAQQAMRTAVMRTQVKFCAWLDLDITHYSVTSPKSVVHDVATQLALALVPTNLGSIDFERERDIVIEEESRRGRDLLSDIYERLYPGSQLGRPSGGSRKSLRLLTRSVVTTYDERFYHPGNIFVGIAGDLKEHELKSLLEPFGHLREFHGPAASTSASSNPQARSGRAYSWKMPRQACALVFSLPLSVSYVELMCLRILAAGFDLVSSPLYKSLRLTERFYDFDATVYCLRNAITFRVRCEAARTRQFAAVRSIAAAIAKTKAKSDEIDAWLSEAKLAFAHLCDPNNISVSNASYLQAYPLATSAEGKYVDPETQAIALREISNDTIQAAACKYLNVDSLSIFVDGPQYPGRRWWYFRQLGLELR